MFVDKPSDPQDLAALYCFWSGHVTTGHSGMVGNFHPTLLQ